MELVFFKCGSLSADVEFLLFLGLADPQVPLLLRHQLDQAKGSTVLNLSAAHDQIYYHHVKELS